MFSKTVDMILAAVENRPISLIDPLNPSTNVRILVVTSTKPSVNDLKPDPSPFGIKALKKSNTKSAAILKIVPSVLMTLPTALPIFIIPLITLKLLRIDDRNCDIPSAARLNTRITPSKDPIVLLRPMLNRFKTE